MRTGGLRRGFTMVDLIAAVGAGAGIAAVGAATLSASSRGSLTQQDQANQMTIGQAAAQWSADHRGLIVGAPGASARELFDQESLDFPDLDTAGLATQPFDWASPLAWGYLSDEPAPERRDERFVRAFGVEPVFVREGKVPVADTTASGTLSVLRDPAQIMKSVPYEGGVRPDGIRDTFFSVQTAGSYVSAREFLWWGQGLTSSARWFQREGPSWAAREPGVISLSGSHSWRLPGAEGNASGSARPYRPYLSRVGTPSEKIQLANGTKYQAADLEAIDHDVSASAGWGGAFSDVGAWASNEDGLGNTYSRAWPRGENQAGQDMTRVSFRHGDAETARGNALRFDGSVTLMDIHEARDPALWLPRGSVVRFWDMAEEYREVYRQREYFEGPAPHPIFETAIIW